jgi:hypothetical protein
MRWLLRIAVGLVVVAGGIYVYYTEIKPTVIFGLRSDYAHAIPYQKIPEGLSSLKAESCGSCHTDIYNEWKTSIHAHAYEDPFFHAYWTKDKHTWVCLNCHAPLENQQPTLITDILRGRVERAVQETNPNFDVDYQREGVTCAACHVRDGVILGPFEDSAAPHPTKFDPTFRTTQVCYRCHNVVGGPAQFYNGGPCGTYAEYEGGYYMKERQFICQSCHMPEIDRPAAVNSPIRRGRQHLWRGGHDPDMVKSAVAIRVTADPPMPKAGDDLTVTLTLMNSGAGHKLPTGDPDRHFTVEFTVTDQDKKVIKEQLDSMGRWIMWQPAIIELYDNRLLPLASRDYTFSYRVPKHMTGLHLNVRVRYHIQTEQQHQMLIKKFGLTADDPYHFAVYERSVPLSSDLAEQFEEPVPAPQLACAASHAG